MDIGISQSTKAYYEFAGIKSVLFGGSALFLLIITALGILLFKTNTLVTFIVSVLSLVIVFKLVWEGVKWFFPRYMLIHYFLNLKKQKKQCNSDNLFELMFIFVIPLLTFMGFAAVIIYKIRGLQ
jgi:hypothetical protein